MQAKQLLSAKGINFRESSIATDPALRTEMMNLSGRRTVPQIWIGDQHIGGCDDLMAMENSGQLNILLEEQNNCLEA